MLINENSSFTYKKNASTQTTTNIKLYEKAKRRGIQIDDNAPLFKDNDLVCVFGKLDNVWKWLFFGYVTTVSFGMAPMANGMRETVTLGCESSLKSLRYNWTGYNALLVPKEFKNTQISDFYDNKYGLSPMASGAELYEQTKQIIFGTHIDSSQTSGMKTGEGAFSLDKLYDFVIKDVSDVVKWKKFLFENPNASDRVVIGDDAALQAKINAMSDWGSPGDNLFPTRNVFRCIVSGADAVVWKHLTGTLDIASLSSLGLTHPAGRTKLDLLGSVLKPFMHVAYTLENGDLVIEPFLYGYDKGVTEKYYTIVDNARITNLNYTFSGNQIATVALCKLALHPFLKSGQEATNLRQKAVVVAEGKGLSVFGFRPVEPEQFVGHIASTEVADWFNRYLLAKSWSDAKTAKATFFPNLDDGYLNAPVYIRRLDGLFLTTGIFYTIDSNKKFTVAHDLSHGLLHDTQTGEYSTDFGGAGAISTLNFFVNVQTALSEARRKVPGKAYWLETEEVFYNTTPLSPEEVSPYHKETILILEEYFH
jgi:hypothetical protein